MEDTDWRPSPCPKCGVMREAARYPVCENTECRDYGRGGPNKIERTMTMKTEPKRYVWISASGDATIIDTDIVELWQSPSFDREKDRIYELGAEVEIKITVAVKNKTVYREGSYAEGTR
jgi:hypothetical protein